MKSVLGNFRPVASGRFCLRKSLFLLLLLLFQVPLAQAQLFRNLRFEDACENSKTGLCHWDLSWGAKDCCNQEAKGKNKRLLLKGNTEKSVSFVEQEVKLIAGSQLQILTLNARVSTENVAGKGAGLNIGMYDQNGSLLATKDMGGFYSLDWIKSTAPWKKYTLQAVVPPGTVAIRIGAILYGKGSARFDNLQVTLSPIGKHAPSLVATTYISAAIDTIARHSLYRDSLDLKVLKQNALKIAGNAKTPADCYLAVGYLLEALRAYGDHHSFFMKPAEVKSWENSRLDAATFHLPEGKVFNQCGYVLVPAFHSGNAQLMQAYTDTLQAILKRLSGEGIKGWIIDLRENTGGNMEPMITGLGPLLDTEKPGCLIDVNGRKEWWQYRNGTYFWNGKPGLIASKPVTLPARLPIAVLTSGQTGSSGETVVISFLGNGHTKFLGQPTWGLTTGNGNFDLPDGARMMLASTVMADRYGNPYKGSIIPDITIEKGEDTEKDTVLKVAASWLQSEK